jgi:hypothetical protein
MNTKFETKAKIKTFHPTPLPGSAGIDLAALDSYSTRVQLVLIKGITRELSAGEEKKGFPRSIRGNREDQAFSHFF